ncbi:MAG: BsuPI-related putative proteinase inhibitor [Haloarculaceae archaeon]
MLECTLSVSGDGPVRFVLAVTNGNDAAVELTFPEGARADFAVHDGGEVWRWSDGRAFAQVVETVRLAPGETIEFEGEWPDPDPGRYEATGELRAAERACTARATVSV